MKLDDRHHRTATAFNRGLSIVAQNGDLDMLEDMVGVVAHEAGVGAAVGLLDDGFVWGDGEKRWT